MPTAVSRLRVRDFQLSRGPATTGLCQSDLAGCCAILNAAQQRLVYAKETGDAGWFGCWAEMVFNVNPSDPHIVTPRGVARLEYMDVCNHPTPIQNQFYSYLRFGFGRRPDDGPCAPPAGQCSCSQLQAYERGLTATFAVFTPGNLVRVYPSSVADAGLRSFISGLDTNDQTVTSLDGPVLIDGVAVTFTAPFSDAPTTFNAITGIQKDTTIGPVSYYQVDPLTSAQSLLLTMEPGEQVAGYRRYFIDGLPNRGCCPPTSDVNGSPVAQVTALAKLEPLPVRVESDYLVIQNLEALIAECQSIRMSEVDGAGPKSESRERHNAAIRLLQGELIHRFGTQVPAVNFAPFGAARTSRQRIGSMM